MEEPESYGSRLVSLSDKGKSKSPRKSPQKRKEGKRNTIKCDPVGASRKSLPAPPRPKPLPEPPVEPAAEKPEKPKENPEKRKTVTVHNTVRNTYKEYVVSADTEDAQVSAMGKSFSSFGKSTTSSVRAKRPVSLFMPRDKKPLSEPVEKAEAISPCDPYKKYCLKAKQYYASGNFAKAIKYYDKALRMDAVIDQRAVKILLRIGDIYVEQQDLVNAKKRYLEALKIAPSDRNVVYKIAAVCRAIKQEHLPRENLEGKSSIGIFEQSDVSELLVRVKARMTRLVPSGGAEQIALLKKNILDNFLRTGELEEYCEYSLKKSCITETLIQLEKECRESPANLDLQFWCAYAHVLHKDERYTFYVRFREITESDPSNKFAWFMQALLMYEQGNLAVSCGDSDHEFLEAVRVSLDKALSVDPFFKEALFMKAFIFKDNTLLAKVLEIDAWYPPALFVMHEKQPKPPIENERKSFMQRRKTTASAPTLNRVSGEW